MSNDLAFRNKLRKLIRDKEGVTVLEYVMILVIVLVVVVAAYKALATKVGSAANATTSAF